MTTLIINGSYLKDIRKLQFLKMLLIREMIMKIYISNVSYGADLTDNMAKLV